MPRIPAFAGTSLRKKGKVTIDFCWGRFIAPCPPPRLASSDAGAGGAIAVS